MLETIATFIDAHIAFFQVWGFIAIFVFMTIESSFIPFPSEVVMIPAGFMAARGELGSFGATGQLLIAILIGVLGSLAGAYANYFLSLKLGKPFLEKYGKWFFVKKAHLDRACEIFNNYGAMTTFICRLLPVIRQLISIPAGISRMKLSSFTFFTALGAGIWSIILALVGWIIARETGDISYLELVVKGKAMAASKLPLVIGCAVAIVALYIAISRLTMREKN